MGQKNLVKNNLTSLFCIVLGFVLAISVNAEANNALAESTPSYFNEPQGSNTSLNWAGYVAGNGTYTSVHGTWTVPYVSNTANTSADATWVGIGGVTDRDLIQAGTEAIINQGQIQYQAWYELLPGASETVPLNVKSGDIITVNISETSQNNWNISFTDSTTGATYQTTVEYASSNDSAEWIEEMPLGASSGDFIPLDSFGSVSFTNATDIDNGITMTPASQNAASLSMVDGNGQALATVSSLGADGQSFTVTRTSDEYNPNGEGSGKGQRIIVIRRFRRQGNGVQGMTQRTRIQNQITEQLSGQIPEQILEQLPPQFQNQLERLFTMQFSRF